MFHFISLPPVFHDFHFQKKKGSNFPFIKLLNENLPPLIESFPWTCCMLLDTVSRNGNYQPTSRQLWRPGGFADYYSAKFIGGKHVGSIVPMFYTIFFYIIKQKVKFIYYYFFFLKNFSSNWKNIYIILYFI